jgi:hypothetical protein
LHRRQFFIGPRPLAPDETWSSLRLGEGLRLSYQQALPVAEARDGEGASWYLLGIALQTDAERPDPLDEIGVTPTNRVEALTSTWSGRWALLGQGVLRTDACLFGCYYARDPESGGLVASSSPALLEQHVGAGEASPPLAYQVGMEWYPPPASRFERIRRLLPSQILLLSGGEPTVRPRPLVRQPFVGTYDETLAFLEGSFRTALRRVAELGPQVRLSLTGGYDTRVLLAAMWREGLAFPTFTWDIDGMTEADRNLPPVLARDAGVSHRVVGRREFDEDRLRLFEEHTAFHTADLDRELVPWGQYDELTPDVTILLGNLFAVGAAYFHEKLPPRPDSVADTVERAFSFGRKHPGSPAHPNGIREWAAWIEAHPEESLDWRDRFLWEQWMAGWCAACEQGADFVDVDFISPANCESMLGAMLNIDTSKRRGKRWQVDLTYRMAPSLADHPYDLGGSLVGRARREVAALRHHPSKPRFLAGRTRSLAVRSRLSSVWQPLLVTLAAFPDLTPALGAVTG